MKKNILALSLLAAVAAGFTACSDDNLSSESVIKPSKAADTVFDKWLYKNFVVPYNIQIQWRYETMSRICLTMMYQPIQLSQWS